MWFSANCYNYGVKVQCVYPYAVFPVHVTGMSLISARAISYTGPPSGLVLS